MRVTIDKIKLVDNYYARRGETWAAVTLIEASKEYEAFDMPLAGLNIGTSAWSGTDTMKGFLYHAKRIVDTDLQYPIILDDEGTVADGWHRILKAILLGRETIKAIRLQEMPSPDGETKAESK